MPSYSDSKIKKGSFRPIEMKVKSRAGLTFGPDASKETDKPRAPGRLAQPNPDLAFDGSEFSGNLVGQAEYVVVNATRTSFGPGKPKTARPRSYGIKDPTRQAALTTRKAERALRAAKAAQIKAGRLAAGD